MFRTPFRRLAISAVVLGLALTSVLTPATAATQADLHHATATAPNSLKGASSKCAIEYAAPMAAPAPKADGRGAALDGQQPDYARSYADDAYLWPQVQEYRRWQWGSMYTELAAKQQQKPDYLDTYRLQADAYLVNAEYDWALSQLDQVLRRDPNDVQALAVTTMIQRFFNNTDDASCRGAHLQSVSPKAAKAMDDFFKATDATQYATYTGQPKTNMEPDAIAIFGQSPNSDGTPSAGMLIRLQKALEMANRYPDSIVIPSGAAVKTQYAEANVMRDWLIQQGVQPGRIVTDTRARDTVGNAMGIIGIMQQYDMHKVLAVGTVQHLPRAVSTLNALATRYDYRLQIDAAGGGTAPDPQTQIMERWYTYVTAARAAGLYELDDFKKYYAPGTFPAEKEIPIRSTQPAA